VKPSKWVKKLEADRVARDDVVLDPLETRSSDVPTRIGMLSRIQL
jgi:hypothetical protein